MKLIFSLIIAINFLINGGIAWGEKTSERAAYLKSRIEQLENQAGTLKEIQALQRELDDITRTPKMPEVITDSDTPFIDGGQKNQGSQNLASNSGNIDFFNENTNLVAVDYGVPKEIVERTKGQIDKSSDKTLTRHATVTPQTEETPVSSSKDSIRKQREDIYATRGILGKSLKIPKKSYVPNPTMQSNKKQVSTLEKPMHGRPVMYSNKTPANVGPMLNTILPVDAPKNNTSNNGSKKSGWGFCENDIPYLQEQLEIKISQLSETQEAIKRTTDGFEIQKLANQIQQLENDKQYYIKMIQSFGGTPKIQKAQRRIAQTTVPAQSQEYQIKSTLENLAQSEKMVRHRIRITKDPRALSALGASLENIQNQRKLLEASAKDTGAMDKTEMYESPNVFAEKAPKIENPTQQHSIVHHSEQQQVETPKSMPSKSGWSTIARQATNPSEIEDDFINDDEVIKSAPQKPLWSDVREPSVRQEQSTRTQKRGRAISQSEAKQIAKSWLSR